MMKYYFNLKTFLFCVFSFSMASYCQSANLSAADILDHLKAHQDQIKSIEADFSMTIFGVNNFKLEQTGTYTFAAPDKVCLTFVTPRPQVVKTEGNKSYISINNGPLKEIPLAEQTAGMNNDLFQYAFLKQFYLDIDTANKPKEGHLYKVLGYHKNEDNSIASDDSVLNAKALEFIYDTNRGLVTQMNFTGSGHVPPIEIKQVYEQKSGCWVPKSVFSKVITPGGPISSVIQLNNKKVEKR